jgi:cold shock protein
MSEGTIKRKTDRGFGFIRNNRGTDVYFHMSAVDGTTFDQLQEGQKVSFEETKSDKGPRAEKVRPL